MNEKKIFKNAFGKNKHGLADFPVKISNVRVARLEWGDARGCSRCFPHGFETSNARYSKCKRSWKYHRKTQWKDTRIVKMC